MNAQMKKLYNVLVVGGVLAAAACDRPGQRPPTTPSPDAASVADRGAPTAADRASTAEPARVNRDQPAPTAVDRASTAEPARVNRDQPAPTAAATPPARDPRAPGSAAAPTEPAAAPTTPATATSPAPTAAPPAGGVRGWFGG